MFIALAVRAGRRDRRWLRRIEIAGSLVTFVPVWLIVFSAVGEWFGMPIGDSFGTEMNLYVTTFGLGTVWVMCGIALGTATLVGIASTWAALGRAHWFLRVSVLGGLLSIALLVPAYEAWLLYLTQSVVAVMLLTLSRRLAGWNLNGDHAPLSEGTAGRRGLQFGLRDVLLFTLFVAAVLAVFASAPKGTWTGESFWGDTAVGGISLSYAASWVLLGVVFGLATWAAAWVVLGRGPWWARVMGFFLAIPLLPCLIWLAIRRRCTRRHSHSRVAAFARAGLVLYSLLLAVPLAAVYWKLVFPPPIPDVALPSPNGYDMLQAAAKPLANVRIPGTPSASVAFVATYRITLDKIHAALAQPSRVPVRYTMDFIDTDRLQSMRQLARALRAEALAATSANPPDDAIRLGGDLLRLAQATDRGGLIIDQFTAMAIEGMGVAKLDGQIPLLDAARCRRAIRMLDAYDGNREPVDDVVRREAVWTDHAYGWFGRLVSVADHLAKAMGVGGGELTPREPLESGFKRDQAELRIVMTKLALRAYRLEHDELPDRLGKLVPKYLPAVPIDPFSGGPLLYKNSGQDYQLQSPGLDRYLNDPGG